ncbi:MAG: hypothetical protein INH37_24895 [Myxococcaceae bacterium]|nr:hypothetical protein [Myxococcaceae bacterium]
MTKRSAAGEVDTCPNVSGVSDEGLVTQALSDLPRVDIALRLVAIGTVRCIGSEALGVAAITP